ncbi:hypothetical protein EUY46_08980 [Salmonella enterica]|nr:hypothetical protein [Salmonella enterica]EAR4750390.1 hypothetical protein [Salmonella enterica]
MLIIINYLHTYQKNCDEHHELYVLNNKFAAIFIFPGKQMKCYQCNKPGILNAMLCTYNDSTDL